VITSNFDNDVEKKQEPANLGLSGTWLLKQRLNSVLDNDDDDDDDECC